MGIIITTAAYLILGFTMVVAIGGASKKGAAKQTVSSLVSEFAEE